LTAEGRKSLEAELAELEAQLPVVSDQLSQARAGGNDPAENLDLRDAMDTLALLEGRVGELRALLAAAEPIDEQSPADGVVRLGARVKIRHADGEEADYQIVSPAEADPRRGRISEESPIGRALVGHQSGEQVTAETPNGQEALAILSVA
jgi:transcription elongation factor GreA